MNWGVASALPIRDPGCRGRADQGAEWSQGGSGAVFFQIKGENAIDILPPGHEAIVAGSLQIRNTPPFALVRRHGASIALELVADPAHRQQIARVGRVVFQFLAQPPHMHIHRPVIVHVAIVAPDGLDQMVAADRSPGMGH